MKYKLTLIIGGLLAVMVIVGGLFMMGKNQHEAKNRNDDSEINKYIKKHHIPTKGDKDAKHHVVVFTDFKCSHCVDFHREFYQDEIKPKIDNGKVKYTEINFPVIDQKSHQYAKMSEAISKTDNDDQYYNFSDQAYLTQSIDKDPV